jgi:hypothetical protein
VNDIKSFDFGHIQKCPFEMLPRPLRPGQTGKDICHIYICLTNVSVCVLRASANGEIVFHQMFLNLVGNIFALREATFVSALKANVSRHGMQGNI